MYRYFDTKLKKNTVNLAPGEFFVSGDDMVINTVLGSCVAVAFYDPQLNIGGLNHFMLAESKVAKPKDGDLFKVERYGLYAMEAVLNEMMKSGSRKSRIQAKIFGGSRVLDSASHMDIGADNISFAEKYLAAEGIPVINQDTGGNRARRIYFYPRTFKILLRRVQPSVELRVLMTDYKQKLKTDSQRDGDVVIFGD